ncbi:MAG: Crp/Fnr family transcriptional regulator [Rhodocyclaceae bacterium]|jgi:CRP/FNR family transcriptional regulator|nr:Crp/Fnr family transcriptional regulator [Rhodocyclaceae bacterium]MCL4759296.1 Crp/Fnr family transcriptional regulator [Rhodocyclaceae bacterium]
MEFDPDLEIRPASGSRVTTFTRGEDLFHAGEAGLAWRIRSGVVRLDRLGETGREFGGLALAGDVLGAETLLLGQYSFSARALTDVFIEPWASSPEAATPHMLLQALSSSKERQADSLALRSGTPEHRISQLLAVMGRGLAHGQRIARVVLPQLRDIAEMTGLTVETVSRTISRLNRSGSLELGGTLRAKQVSIDLQSSLLT